MPTAATGQSHLVLELIDDKFLDENYDVAVGNGNIVLTNWSDGHNHIYLYSYDANPGAQRPSWANSSPGRFRSYAISSIDWAKKMVYFASNEGNPLEQQLWQVSFDGAAQGT